MAFAVNFGETDKANRLMWMLQQDWLGRRSQERRMKYLGEQESMYGRVGDARSQRRIAELLQGHDLNKQLAILKALMDASKDPTLDRFRKKAEVLRAAGQDAEADDYERQFNEALPQYAIRAKKVVEGGEIPKEDWAGIFDIVGVDYGRDLMGKWQTAKKTELGYAQLEEKEATRLGKEGVESKSQKSYYEHVKGLGNQAIMYIKGLKQQPDPEMEGPGLYGGVLTQKQKGDVLSTLRGLVNKAKTGRLNRDQELFLRNAMNLDKLKQATTLSRTAEGDYVLPPDVLGPELGPEPLAEAGVAPLAPTEAPGAGVEAGIEEKVQRLVTLILAEAQRQGKEITPEQAEELARRAIGR